jgi:hypothetical protein
MTGDIPYGCYCYEIVGVTDTGVIHTRMCPYYTYLDDGLKECILLRVKSDEDELLDDQCKICGFNEEDCDYKSDPIIKERN